MGHGPMWLTPVAMAVESWLGAMAISQASHPNHAGKYTSAIANAAWATPIHPILSRLLPLLNPHSTHTYIAHTTDRSHGEVRCR